MKLTEEEVTDKVNKLLRVIKAANKNKDIKRASQADKELKELLESIKPIEKKEVIDNRDFNYLPPIILPKNDY